MNGFYPFETVIAGNLLFISNGVGKVSDSSGIWKALMICGVFYFGCILCG